MSFLLFVGRLNDSKWILGACDCNNDAFHTVVIVDGDDDDNEEEEKGSDYECFNLKLEELQLLLLDVRSFRLANMWFMHKFYLFCTFVCIPRILFTYNNKYFCLFATARAWECANSIVHHLFSGRYIHIYELSVFYLSRESNWILLWFLFCRNWRRVSTMVCFVRHQMEKLVNFWTKNVGLVIIRSMDRLDI